LKNPLQGKIGLTVAEQFLIIGGLGIPLGLLLAFLLTLPPVSLVSVLKVPSVITNVQSNAIFIKPKPTVIEIVKMDSTVLVIASTLFWETRGEPIGCKRLVATSIWLDADSGEPDLYIKACLNTNRFPSWNGHDMNIARMRPPVEKGHPEYEAWRDCVKIAVEMVNRKFVPIGIYNETENAMSMGNILYPTYFHATDGKRRTWPPKNAIVKNIARQTYYFQEIKSKKQDV